MVNANCVCIQLGQCGTQVGHEFLNGLYEDCFIHTGSHTKDSIKQSYASESMPVFFNELKNKNYLARSVMVDMEPKAVTWALSSSKSKNWRYPEGQQLCRKSGSGNNWSYGYQVHGPRCETEVIELVRKEVEKCDRFGGFFVLMSLAGGTGSGVGSYLLQILHDLYSQSPILNSVVLPYSAGEVAVQNYNAILTLSGIISNADASILLHNDHLHKICKHLLAIPKVSFKDLNKVAAHDLGSLFQPSVKSNKSSSMIHNILTASSSHSCFKFLNLKTVPHIAEQSVNYSTFNWNGLIKRIRQMHITNSHIDEGMNWHIDDTGKLSFPKSLSNLLILRGKDSNTIDSTEFQSMRDKRFYVPWIPHRERCPIWTCSRPYMAYEKSATLLTNGGYCVSGLNNIVQRGWDMFSAKAYVHQYTKYGLEQEDFLNAFIKIENVLKNYATL